MRLSSVPRVMAACLALVLAGTGPSLADVGTIPAKGIGRHLQALQDIATAHGGNRAAGTAGYDRSVEYVAGELERAGYAIRFEAFSFPYFEERRPPALVARAGGLTIPQGRDALRTLHLSGSGDVEARVQGVDLGPADDPPAPSTSGCEREDFSGFQAGRIALLRRGTCAFQAKADNATAAGAAGIVIMNEGTDGQREVFGGRLTSPARIPVLAVSADIGRQLQRAAEASEDVEFRLAVDAEAGTRVSRNVVAEREGLAPDTPYVLVGAHLDSVAEGPGINDNGSGTAALIAAATHLAEDGLRPVRFAFWGAEERGLIGSRHHVGKLSDEERRRIALYVNLDMVGSPNPGRFLRSSGEPAPGLGADLRRALAAYFRDRSLPFVERASGAGRRIGGGSDDASFAQAGIATVMLYTGAGEAKGIEQADRFGGTPGRPYDPCYHQACDTVANVDHAVLSQMSEALLDALRRLPPPGGDAPRP